MIKTINTKEITERHQRLAQYIDKVNKYPRVRSFFWLLICSDVLNKYASMEIGKRGDKLTELGVLQISLKHPEGIPQRDIAKQTGRTKQAIVLAIDNLVRKGRVIRCADNKDRRINNIKITPEGLDDLSKIFPHTEKMCYEALSSLSDSEIDELLDIIVKLTKNLWKKIESKL
jgi:DNA-binding MarR family transcriptional regulator